MSNELDMPLGQRTAVVSLVAVFACALASDAVASRLPTEPSAGEVDLSARVAAIVERIRLSEPALQRDLPPEVKIAQWRNR
jgi:hypothetical protein